MEFLSTVVSENSIPILIWLFLTVFAVVIETQDTGLISIWFGFGALVAFVTSLFIPSIYIQIAIFLIISLTSLLLCKKVFKFAIVKKTKDNVTNLDSFIGEKVKVLEQLDDDLFSVKFRGNTWKAYKVDDFQKIIINEKAELVSFKGNRLIIKQIVV